MYSMEEFADLQHRLGYVWNDPEILREAFRHTTWCNEHPVKPSPNERLEFLGDAVLDLLSAEFLMVNMPTSREGALSQARTNIVKTCSLAMKSRELGLGQFILVGKGAEYLRDIESVLADTLEAVIGAAYTDGGLQAAREVAIATKVLR